MKITPEAQAGYFRAMAEHTRLRKLADAKKQGVLRLQSRPFRDGMIGKFFEHACRPEGLTISELERVCEVVDAPAKDYLRKLYRGYAGSWSWKIELREFNGDKILRITELQQHTDLKREREKRK